MHQFLSAIRRPVNIIKQFNRFHVSNVSQKKLVYSFEAASSYHLHPKRNFVDGTDRFIIMPNLIVITDHGTGRLGKN